MSEISPQVRGGKLEKINQEMVEAVAHLCQVNVKVDISEPDTLSLLMFFLPFQECAFRQTAP